MSKVNEIMEIVKGMTVLELSELVKALEEEFGVSAAAPAAVVAAPAGAPAEAAEEEKDEFDVILTGPGEQTIAPLPESVDVVIRSKDTGSRLTTISCVTLILDPSEPMWEPAAAALAAERLNATDDQIERWRTEGTIYVLHPYGAPTDRPGAYPATSGATRFAPGRATTSWLRPRHLCGR